MFGNAYSVVSKKFCCCLPVRIGVFVLSLLTAVLGGLSAAAVWYTVIRTAKYGTVDGELATFNGNNTIDAASDLFDDDDFDDALNSIALDKTQFYVFIAIGVITTIYTLFSIFGFLGAVFRKRALVAIYSTALWILLLVNLGVGIYMCIAVSQRKKELEAECKEENDIDNAQGQLQEAQNDVVQGVCAAAAKVGLIFYIAIFVVHWLIQLYCCIIVKRYVEQLHEEQEFRQHNAGNKIGTKGGVTGSYYPHQPLGSQVELSGPYPYTQADHSYGSKA